MKVYTFSFRGRRVGAIGVFYKIKASYKCNSMSEAKTKLYKDYEHIHQLKVISGGTLDEYNKANFIEL
jgi:hypothetical protein